MDFGAKETSNVLAKTFRSKSSGTSPGFSTGAEASFGSDARVHDDPISADLARPGGFKTRHCIWTSQITHVGVSQMLQIIRVGKR